MVRSTFLDHNKDFVLDSQKSHRSLLNSTHPRVFPQEKGIEGRPRVPEVGFVISKRPLSCICVYSDSFMCTSLYDWYQALCINICTWCTE